MDLSPAHYRALAIATANKALEIDGQLAEGHAALGFARLYDWDWAGAELELRRALELNPTIRDLRQCFGGWVTSETDPGEAGHRFSWPALRRRR